MNKILLLSLLFLGATAALAQTKSVEGRVLDTSSVPISGATVVMLRGDSAYIAATITDDNGIFSFSLNEQPAYLQFSHIAYEDSLYSYSQEKIGDIVLSPSAFQIEEVTVKAYRPIVKAEEGKLSYNLSQLSEQTTATNVYESLRYVPGVDEENGALTLAGVGAATVIINGKPSTMSPAQLETLLRSMPIERIKSAEVMYSTPPQYGVRGASINLVLDQSRDYTYSGQMQAGASHQNKGSWGSGGSFMMSTPKWSADVMYNYNDSYSPQLNEQEAKHTVGGTTKRISQVEDLHSRGKQHTARAAFDYTPTEKHSLSVVYNGDFSPSVHSVADSKGSYVESLSDKQGENFLHNATARYTVDGGLDIGADYTSYKNTSLGSLANRFDDGTASAFDVSSGQRINRVNFYAGMSHALQKGWSVNYGTNASWAKSRDFQHYSSATGGVGTKDTDSELSELSTEIYGGFSKKLPKGSLSASLTGEYYNLEGEEKWMLYPQLNFMWMFDPENILQANVSSDKTYPSYWMLQDAISYVDGYTEIHGNPFLRPMREYASQVIYIRKQRYVFVLFGSQTNDYFTQNSYLAPDRFSLIYKNLNFDYSRQYGANAIVPLRLGKWYSAKATLTGVRMEQKCSDFFGLSFDRSAWVGITKLDNTFKLSDNCSLELNAIYQTSAIQGLFDLGQSWGVDAGVKWSLLDKRLDLTAKCQDVFESRMPSVVQNWQGQELRMYTGGYSRFFSLKLSYTFGGYTKKDRKEVDSDRFGH